MTKQEILVNIYNKLRFSGIVHSKKEFAEQIGYNNSCLSSAFGGSERYLTNGLFKRIAFRYPQVSSAYIERGEGDILIETSVDSGNDRSDNVGQNIIPDQMSASDCTLEMAMRVLQEQQAITRMAQEQLSIAMSQVDSLMELIRRVSSN